MIIGGISLASLFLALFLFARNSSSAQRAQKLIELPSKSTRVHHLTLSTSRWIRSTNISLADKLLQKIEEKDDEWRLLKKKRKRLRQLRQEVRELSSQLHTKRISRDKNHLYGENLKDKMKARKEKVLKSHWRRQISTKVKAILKRLKRLESLQRSTHVIIRDKEKKGVLKKEQNRNFYRTTIGPLITSAIYTTQDIKMRRLHTSINQSKNGESGGICSGHMDCKPGLCCHHITSNSNRSVISSKCIEYSLQVGEFCEDSCQCEARLHCFKALPSTHSGRVIRSGAQAKCKKVSADDIANGIYLNSKGFFSAEEKVNG